MRYYTKYYHLCQTECATNGKSYYWCWYGKHSWNWDYCSPHKNIRTYYTAPPVEAIMNADNMDKATTGAIWTAVIIGNIVEH